MRWATLLLAAGLTPDAGPHVRNPSSAAPKLDAAEALIDAFYAFDRARLRAALVDAPETAPVILYYQGWAQGGNYAVIDRKPCRLERDDQISCDIKVKDDLIAALRTGYDVTDTFHLTFKDGRIVQVTTSSDDPPDMKQAFDWLRTERPELIDGPCRGFFAGGPTPQDCVRAVVEGFKAFKARR